MGLLQGTRIRVDIDLRLPNDVVSEVRRIAEQTHNPWVALPPEAIKVRFLSFDSVSDISEIRGVIDAVRQGFENFRANAPRQNTFENRINFLARGVERGRFHRLEERVFKMLQINDVDIGWETPFNPRILVGTTLNEPNQVQIVAAPPQWDVIPSEQLFIALGEPVQKGQHSSRQ